MTIPWSDQYKTESGYEVDGTFYQDRESLLQCELFGFCGCGDPTATFRLVAPALRALANSQLTWQERDAATHADGDVRYLLWYVLDRAGLTEHGGSVPGWLTDKGKQVLADLEREL